MIVVNLFAGPGTGKSTTAAAVFSELKFRGVNAELVTEFAKHKVWENSPSVLDDQLYLLGKQHHKQFILNNQVDVAVTDSPLPLLLEYGKGWGPEFADFVIHVFNQFDNLNIFLLRQKEYNPIGRLQTEEKARQIDDRILTDILAPRNIKFHTYRAERDSIHLIADMIMSRLGK